MTPLLLTLAAFAAFLLVRHMTHAAVPLVAFSVNFRDVGPRRIGSRCRLYSAPNNDLARRVGRIQIPVG
jgi:hypothetical protein